jgi:hypothetical protein
MKIVITQFVKQKEELENELKNKNNTKPPASSTTTKTPASFLLNLKKPSSLNSKTNVKYTSNIIAKEVLTLKT